MPRKAVAQGCHSGRSLCSKQVVGGPPWVPTPGTRGTRSPTSPEPSRGPPLPAPVGGGGLHLAGAPHEVWPPAGQVTLAQGPARSAVRLVPAGAAAPTKAPPGSGHPRPLPRHHPPHLRKRDSKCLWVKDPTGSVHPIENDQITSLSPPCKQSTVGRENFSFFTSSSETTQTLRPDLLLHAGWQEAGSRVGSPAQRTEGSGPQGSHPRRAAARPPPAPPPRDWHAGRQANGGLRRLLATNATAKPCPWAMQTTSRTRHAPGGTGVTPASTETPQPGLWMRRGTRALVRGSGQNS